ncbi:hypothetical protein MJD09_01075 [bacterium]|nr:hypothetical protein [bacterium]
MTRSSFTRSAKFYPVRIGVDDYKLELVSAKRLERRGRVVESPAVWDQQGGGLSRAPPHLVKRHVKDRLKDYSYMKS